MPQFSTTSYCRTHSLAHRLSSALLHPPSLADNPWSWHLQYPGVSTMAKAAPSPEASPDLSSLTVYQECMLLTLDHTSCCHHPAYHRQVGSFSLPGRESLVWRCLVPAKSHLRLNSPIQLPSWRRASPGSVCEDVNTGFISGLGLMGTD